MRLAPCLIALLLAVAPCLSSAQTVIGVVADGPVADNRRRISIDAIADELENLLGDADIVRFPAEKRIDGGWSGPGVEAAVRRLLDDPEVDIVLTTGIVAGNVAKDIENLPKPVIAIVVADHELQAFPFVAGSDPPVSGKDNFVYLSDFNTIDDELRSFHEAFTFDHLAVLLDELTDTEIPNLAGQKAVEIEAALDIEITIIPVEDSADAALAAIAALPSANLAVYVTPLLRFDAAEMRALGAGLIEQRLPSLSLLGRRELDEYDLLMATGGRAEDGVRLTRRVAINLQRIMSNENAGQIGVIFPESQRRIINMGTAERIDRVPSFAILTESERIPALALESGPPMSLADAMLIAVSGDTDLDVEGSLALKVQEYDLLLSEEQVTSARSALRPRLGLGASRVTIDEDRANPLIQSERSTSAELLASQLIYSDDAWARLRAAVHVDTAIGFEYAAAVLDTYRDAAVAYLTVLRAREREGAQRSNLELTRSNLELARIRERIGITAQSDRLRWESQYATDLQNVMAAEAERHASLTALNRILNLPQDRDFTTPQEVLANSIGLFLNDDRFRSFIEDQRRWEIFQRFTISQSVRQAPEIQRIDSLIAAQERQLLASERKSWLPEFAVGASAGSVLSRSGAGSSLTGTGLDDESWSLALTANLPLFSGGAVRSESRSNRYALRQLEQAREALLENIEARTRLALYGASGTYPAIEQAAEAERAARENLELVNQAYTAGVVSVTEVIDAQDTANLAELRATDTLYAALIDVIEVFRSSGDLSIFYDTESIETWYEEVASYFSAQGVALF